MRKHIKTSQSVHYQTADKRILKAAFKAWLTWHCRLPQAPIERQFKRFSWI